ncbi:MAG: ankyrin repeat domain-containing protein [Elusimicrobiaceae bacterium]|nr:ankyrin repeat domain-containing protein [Elusimicrobiaceae bacterium]
MKTFLLGLFLILPVALLVLYTANTTHKETSPTSINVSNLKLIPPVAIINEITNRIEEGDLEDALAKINAELPDPNIVSSNGTPLIVLAAEKDYTDIVSALLQKGADPNKADLNTSETALIKAIRNRSFDTISVLLNAGADPNLGTKQGLTPLGLAIDLKDETLASHLLSSGAINGISKENLLLYAFKKNPIGVSLMLSGGVSPSVTDQDNNTPLIISAANGDLESAKYLVSYRANLNAKNNLGMTPLLYALKGKHWKMAEYLMNNGAKINSSNIYGQNALFWAAYHGNADLVQNLLMRGANYQKKTRKGQTALQMAQALGHKEAAKMIEDFIAYKNLPRDEKGNIILPKVNQQAAEVPAPVSAPSQEVSTSEYVNNVVSPEIKNKTQQNRVIVQQTQENQKNQVLTPKVQSNTQVQISQQSTNTQINTLQNTDSQAEMPQMPQMPAGMDMSAITSMVNGQGSAAAENMGEMIKQMQNMGMASQNGSKTQQLQNMPSNVQMPNGMNMNDISKMIPAGALPEGVDLNNLTSMSPEQLKKMGVPEDQIANITKAQQQISQAQGTVSPDNGFKPKDLENTPSATYANGMPKTQINKLQTSGN